MLTTNPWRKAQRYAAFAERVLNNARRRKGLEAECRSQRKATNKPTSPKKIGTMVRQLFHGNCVPPPVMPTRKMHVLARNKAIPNQSSRRSRSFKLDRSAYSFTEKGT